MPCAVSLKVQLANGERVSVGDGKSAELTLGDRTVSLQPNSDGFRLLTRGFGSEEEARWYVPVLATATRVWAAERWMTASVVAEVKRPYIFSSPEEEASGSIEGKWMAKAVSANGLESEVDGCFNDSDTVVYSQELRLVCVGGSGNATKVEPVGIVESCLREAVENDVVSVLAESSRVDLAVDLAIAGHKERSPRARLFGFIAAIESLVEDEQKPGHVQSVVDDLVAGVRRLAASDESHRQDYDELAQRLGGLRFESAAARVKRLLLDGLPEETPYGGRDELVAEIMKAHGKTRGKLIHGHAHPETLDLDLNRINMILGWAVIRLVRLELGLSGDPPVS